MRVWAMAQTACALLDDATKLALSAIARDRSWPLKHILRARIVPLSSERFSVQGVARQAGVIRPAVWRLKQCFAKEDVEALLRDKTRPARTPPHSARTVAKVLALIFSEPPDEVTHWTGHAAAVRTGISLRSVQRIWKEHRLQPYRVRTFKRSHDSAFAEKVSKKNLKSRLWSKPVPTSRSDPGIPSLRRTTGPFTAPQRCLPSSTSWKAQCLAAASSAIALR